MHLAVARSFNRQQRDKTQRTTSPDEANGSERRDTRVQRSWGRQRANLVEETRRRQQNNDETHVDSDSPSKNPAVRSVAYAGYPTNRTLFDPDTKLTPAIPELNPENHNRARSYSIQSFKSQAKKQHRISLPYYYHLHSLPKIFFPRPENWSYPSEFNHY